jgi:23S rRNA pseudouridine955/2504/2580 synthase
MNKSYTIKEIYSGMRIDRWIRNNVASLPQSLIEKSLRKGKIKVNIKKVNSSYKLKTGDKIKFFNFTFEVKKNKETNKKFSPSSELLKVHENRILENNDDFIVIDKSPGVPVQGGTKSKKNLIDILASSEFFKDTKPFPVHRLDKETSGIMIISKNHNSARLLTTLFRLRKIHKTYLAVCHGHISKKKGELKNELITFENNKKKIEKAITYYKVLSETDTTSFLELKPVTGRKHQLRKQLAIIDNPIVGDKKYILSNKKIKSDKDLMLHAYSLKFYINNKKFFYKASPPDAFNKYLNKKKLNILNF